MAYRLFTLTIILLAIFSACGEKEKEVKKEVATVKEFVALFPQTELPLTFSDSVLALPGNDSFLIEPAVYQRFVPDSLYPSVFDTATAKIYPIGKFGNLKEETYLLAKAVLKNKRAIFLSAFDKNDQFIAGMPVLSNTDINRGNERIMIDARLNITREVTRQQGVEGQKKGQDVYALNKAAKTFMLIMTDSLGAAATELVNPIDTLPKTQKFSADYGEGKMNLISVRDGQREGRFVFFLHLEKQNKKCIGELKGEAVFTAPNVAEYRQGGDPCILQFTFTNNGVAIKEVEGCGSRMGALECTFDGNYPKKKIAKKNVAAPKPIVSKPASKKR